jgi:RNA polymerase sigma-70 factor (ECF subfamily)
MPQRSAATQDYDVFLSYSSKDRPIAEEANAALQREGLRVFDPLAHSREMWGANVSAYLSDVIASRVRGIIVFISNHYSRSRWCETELNAIQTAGRDVSDSPLIFPVRVDDSPVPQQLADRIYLDLSATGIDELARIAKDRLASRTPAKEILAALSDEELYKRFAETRSAEAVELLFERLYPIVRAACASYGLPAIDAEDIAQDTIIRLLHRAPELASVGNFRRLIWAMARSSAVQLHRRKLRESAANDDSRPREVQRTSDDQQRSGDEPGETQAAIERAQEALQSLPAHERKLVMLHLVNGVSYQEMSRLLSVSPATVRLRLHRILDKLRNRFEVGAENA